jgi:hypothetical protein
MIKAKNIINEIEDLESETLVKVPRFIYHYSEIENIKSILTNGLIPSRGGEDAPAWHPYSYSPRVFFSVKCPKGSYSVALFKVDTRKLSDVTFYEDTRWEGGVWTPSKIPPDAIKLIAVDGRAIS